MLNWRKDKQDPEEPGDAPTAPPLEQTDSSPPRSKVHHPRSRLGVILVEEGAITQSQLDEALATQARDGGFLGQILIQLKHLHRETLVSFLVKQCKIPHLSLLDYQINEALFEYIPKKVCAQYSLLPIDKLGRILTVAMVDPLDIGALEAVRASCPDLKIKPILCDWYHFETVAGRLFDLPKSGEEQSASSFGLSERPKPPKPEPSRSRAEGESLPKPADAEVQPTEAPSAPFTPSKPEEKAEAASPQDLSSVLRQSVREAIQEAMSALAKAPHDAKGAPSGDALVNAVGESVRHAMEEIIGLLKARLPESGDAASGQTQYHPEQLAATISQELRETMRETLAALAQEARPAGHGAPSSAEIAVLVRESVQEAMRDATKRWGSAPEAAGADRRRRQESVTPFDRAERDAMEAMGSGDVRRQADEKVLEALASEQPLSAYTFDGYFVGKANTFTVALSKAVAEKPGGEYNPFFLYGDVGIGKTHLINAIGNYICAKSPSHRVGYVSSSRFASRLVDAIQEHAVDAFRESYCHWDVLILDDIQFMGGGVEAQEEFFHIFNALHQEGRQIIIAGDKPPDQLGQLEKRLVSRFAGGIVASLRPPEWETRIAILRHQIKGSKVKVPEDVLSLIATRVPDDVRKMSGSMRKMIAFASLTGQDISSDLASEILSHMGIPEVA